MTSCVLSIGTSHPWNVAGIGRDAVVGAELGVRVLTAVAAVSAQDEHGVRALYVLPAAALRAQLDALAGAQIAAARIGALGSAENVDLVAAFLHSIAPVPAVVDPVFAASAGGALADEAAIVALRDHLATLVNVVLTPNLCEAAMLLGRERIERGELEEAASALYGRGAHAILLKGGHLAGDPIDALASSDGVEAFDAPRIGAAMPGTGCTLAMALACELARGRPLRNAVAA
ncbi:MAG TPA: hydroxymethylpyrimidine/phosphomethylpyrimidine kinase, partial [Candidatus Tyrphobacter sp.]